MPPGTPPGHKETQMPKRGPLPYVRHVYHDPDESRYVHRAAEDVNYTIDSINELIERVNLLEAELEPLREAKRKA